MSQAPTPGTSSAVNAPHVIRLRRPWLREAAATSNSKRLTYTRRFGTPGNLTTDDCVELVVAGVDGLNAIWLNGSRLEVDVSAGPVRVAVNRRLAARNELKLVIDTGPQDVESNREPVVEIWQDSGAVRLEIRVRQ